MTETDDHSLVEKARQGDLEAIGELYRRWWRAARAAAYAVTGDLSTAEDIASEAFQLALDGLKGLRDPSRFGPWLRTIVRRQARPIRSRAFQGEFSNIESVPDTKSSMPELAIEQRETAALVQQAVSELPPDSREAISLHYFEGYRVEEAAHFLEIPSGTFKRHLHEGRERLRKAAGRILEGKSVGNHKRERILQQLSGLLEEGGDSESFYQAIRQALQLRPVPRDLFRNLVFSHPGVSEALSTLAARREAEIHFTKLANRVGLGRPSDRVLDSNNPIGKVACAIRSALPDFKDWHIDVSEMGKFLVGVQIPDILPPDFAEGQNVSYLRLTRGLLFKALDGSIRTSCQFLHESGTQHAFTQGIRESALVSDVLYLVWTASGHLELRSVETLLRQLSRAVLSDVPIRFVPHEEARYRSALRLQLSDMLTPAAVGGILVPWPGRPEGVSSAEVRIFLEPWAEGLTGQVVPFSRPSELLGGCDGESE